MTIVVRRFASSPERTSAETWKAIVKMLAPSDKWKTELNAITGTVSSIISNRLLKDDPLVVRGSGPLLRVYCLYDDEAVVGEDKKEDGLNWGPISGDWKIFLPCQDDMVATFQKIISKHSTRVELYSVDEGLDLSDRAANTESDNMTVDIEALRNA